MRTVMVALMLSLVGSALAADEPVVLREYEKLRQERAEAWAAYSKLGRKTSKIEDLQALADKNPDKVFIPRMVELAEKHAGDPAAVVPALFVLRASAPGGKDKLHERAAAVLVKQAASKHLAAAVPTLIGQDEDTAQLLRAIVAKHPDVKARARACRLLVAYLGDCVEKGADANLDEEFRQKLEKQTSREHVKGLIDRLNANRKEHQALWLAFQNDYRKLLPDLSPGLKVPDAAFTDVDDKKHTLKDFRGKVLLVHVFSVERNRPDWLYYNHKYWWDEEFKGRPVVRVNVSIDERRETFTTWLRHHPLEHVNVWAGRDSDFFADWLSEEREREMTYLVDAAGLIRMRSPATNDLFGPLDQKIADLFAEMKLPARETPAAPKVKADGLSEAALAYEQLRSDFRYAAQRYQRALILARTDEDKRKALGDYDWRSYVTRTLELAEKHIKDPAAFDLLALRLRYQANLPKDETMHALFLLGKHYADSPRVGELLRPSPYGGMGDPVFLAKVLEKNPDAKIRARACLLLREQYERSVAGAEQYLRADEELQRAIRRRSGEEYVKELLDTLEKNKELKAKYIKLWDEKYAHVLPEFPIGKPMIDTELTTLEGKKFKLSDLKGKVVYLTLFSAEEHRPTFNHQRMFADQVKGKPFVIVNVSIDEKKEYFEEALKRDPSPWTNCWAGRKGELYAYWMNGGHQTAYLIDARGVLRSRNVFWGDLPDRAEELIAEATKPASR